MSVVEIKRLQERSGTIGSNSRISQTYLIRTNSRDDDYFVVRDAIEGEVGGFLASHPENIFYTRREIKVSASSPLHWVVTVPWSTESISSQERERNDYPNPIDRTAKISVESRETQKYVTKDVEGNPIQNTAGEPFEPIVADFTDVIINIRQNLPGYAASWLQAYNNSTNLNPVVITGGNGILTLDAGYGLIKGMSFSSLQQENGYNFYEGNIQVHVTHDDTYQWKTVLVNEGFRYLDGTDLIHFFEKDESGTLQDGTGSTEEVRATNPKKLSLSGGAAADDAPPELLEFKIYRETDWSYLPFFYPLK